MGGKRPKFTFIGWKLFASAPPVMCVTSAPIAVSGGGGGRSRPRISAAAIRPARSPMAALSTYPSTPVTCPAKRMFGLSFSRIRSSSRVGEFRKVLRWMPPSRAKLAFSSPGIILKTAVCAPYFIFVWKPTIL